MTPTAAAIDPPGARSVAGSLAAWRDRHRVAGPGWAARYWDSVDMPHRVALERAWGTWAPAPLVVLEIGCNAGPNLRRAARRWPHARLIGVDANAEAIRYLRAAAAAEGWGRRLDAHVDDAAAFLVGVERGAVDLAFSCYSLAYQSAGSLIGTLALLRHATRRRIVLAEPMTGGEPSVVPLVSPVAVAHNYRRAIRAVLLAARAPAERVTLTPHDGPDGLNGIVTWEVA